MSPGKMAAQAGHAFLDTFVQCRARDPTRAEEYHDGSHGTKVVLGADLQTLMQIHELAKEFGLPSSLVIDSGHVMPPHFDGTPIVTAVGIGPARRHECPSFLRQLPLVR